MDELIALVKRKTAEILTNPGEVSYREIVDLVEIRGQLLHAMQEAGLSEKDKIKYREQLVGFLRQNDEPIINIATRIKSEAAKHLKKISSGAVLRNVYESHHDPGSLFYDKRK